MGTQKNYQGIVSNLTENYKNSEFNYTSIDLNTKNKRDVLTFYGKIPREFIGKGIFVSEKVIESKGKKEIYQTLRKDNENNSCFIITETTFKGKSILDKIKRVIN